MDKFAFKVPFVCGCRDLGEALRRIGEGAALMRTKGEAGTGNIVEAVRHMRAVMSGIRRLTTLRPEELMAEAKNLGAPYELVRLVAETGRLPVPNFAAGGIATPADAALMMALGAESVFVGSGIFKSADPARRAKAIVRATTHWQDAEDRGRGLARPRRGHARPRDRADPRGRAARRRGAGDGRAVRRPRPAGRLRRPRARPSDELGVHVREVRRVADLEGLAGLMIPGGESTTLLNLMGDEPWFEALRRLPRRGRRSWPAPAPGPSCSAREVRPRQASLGLLDAVIERNAFGRQVDSFEAARRRARRSAGPWTRVFIRAPRFRALCPDVEVLARYAGRAGPRAAGARRGGHLPPGAHPLARPSTATSPGSPAATRRPPSPGDVASHPGPPSVAAS